MSLIINNLYVSPYSVACDKAWLLRHNITHIVNVAGELDNVYPGEFYYFNVFFYDNHKESLFPSIVSACKFIDDALSRGGRVLVHCYAGKSRSTSTIIFFLMKYCGLTFDEAFSYMKKVHPITSPNASYVEQLSAVRFH